ncbi:hypothetical protein EKN38_22255 [Enterobacter sp. WCHEn045836]|uniref:MarC family protein n=1 Tax=Enterobacter sp. WCHEn045836 TaxID=2497434 RepID=UPI000F847A98|nr:MarC family protein [Enterobacter sp. WCHEn045836]RTP97269.1 hypothetical protein EKN38_22255 [Enterobacter sp. WCHEn045836]
MLIDFYEVLIMCLVMLLPIAHPLTGMALFMGFSERLPLKCRKDVAIKSSIYSFLIMLAVWLSGTFIMENIGVSISGIKIAGGVLLIVAGFGLLFPPSNGRGASYSFQGSNIAFMPIALPGTAGPGVISMIIGFDSFLSEAGYEGGRVKDIAIIASFVTISFLLWLGLSFANRIFPVLGATRIAILSCLIGFVQFCVGAQFVIDGIKQAFF